ncbi:hypothetical protein ACFQH6_15555 [Halobacteriaceae archaeon GCM10025711]
MTSWEATLLLDAEARHPVERDLLVVGVPGRGADVLDDAVARDDEREFAEAVGPLDRLAGAGHLRGVQHAREHRMEYLVELVPRDGKGVVAVEAVVEFDRRLASALRDDDPLGVVGVLVDGLVAQESVGVVDDSPRRRDVQHVLALEGHLGGDVLAGEGGLDESRNSHAEATYPLPPHKSDGCARL